MANNYRNLVNEVLSGDVGYVMGGDDAGDGADIGYVLGEVMGDDDDVSGQSLKAMRIRHALAQQYGINPRPTQQLQTSPNIFAGKPVDPSQLDPFTSMVDLMTFSGSVAAGGSITVVNPQRCMVCAAICDTTTAGVTLSTAQAGGIPFLGVANTISLVRFQVNSQNYRVKRQVFQAGVPFVITVASPAGPTAINLTLLGIVLG